MKFGRTYSLSVEVAGGQRVTIEPPFTCEFEVSRNSLASANTGFFRIFNLAERTRNLIYKDRFAVQDIRAIQFRAGYESESVPMIFNGQVRCASSYRVGGAADTMTELEAFDGGFQMTNGFTSMTVESGAVARNVLQSLAATLPGITGSPIVGNFPGINKRGEVLFGNTWKLILEKSRGLATIDNGQPKILQDNETITGEIPLITSDTGLLGSPRRSSGTLDVEMLFEPRLTVGQVVDLKSSVNTIFNGRFKVMGFTHRGTISPAVGGECRTTLSLWLGTQVLEVIKGTPIQ
jgi:hypothetical protein